MIQAKYPIDGTNGFLIISIEKPKKDSFQEEECNCKWTISAPNFEKTGISYGVDEIQALYLAFEMIKANVKYYESSTKMKCEYLFF